MSTKIAAFGALILSVLLTLCIAIGAANGMLPYENKATQSVNIDSISAICVQNLVNPLFESVDDAISFKNSSIEGKAIDEEFNNMPDKILETVVSVCIKRDGPVSKRGIVYEYRANKDVYDNLPNHPQPIENLIKTAIDSSKTSPAVNKKDTIPREETRYSQKDTTIGGKKYKMRTKTEISYE